MTIVHDDPIYAMGYSEAERDRLIEQATLYADATRHLLADAGIGPGQRVLDVGCGVGDVSLLAAELVGSEGSVIAVDKDPRALEVARARAAAADVHQLDFVESDLRGFTSDEPFDAVIGRFVLMYVADPTATVSGLTRHLRDGGVLAFQEFQFEGLMLRWPAAEASLYERTVCWVVETFRRAGVETNMGARLALAFRDAGLGLPRAYVHCPLASGAEHPAYSLFAHVLESIKPLTESFGIATADELDPTTYAKRLSEEMLADDAVVCCAPVVGAWARLTTAPSPRVARDRSQAAKMSPEKRVPVGEEERT